MPELPEVETIVRDLKRLVTGAAIREVEVVKEDLIVGRPAEFATALRGRTIEDVSRRAKNIVLRLDFDLLVINLGMTGRVVVSDAEGAADVPYLGVRLTLADGRAVLYQDPRRFGRLETLSAEAWNVRSKAMGIEPLSADLTATALYDLSRRSRTPVKTWLMDQKRIVGIGNIYASEALFRAGISPRKAARRISKREAAKLHNAIREVLQEAIEFRGTTLLDYRDANGEEGAFARRLRVYDRAGEPCVRCGTPIRRIVQGGRSTFYCPVCQR